MCGIITDEPYYGLCRFVPYCTQQHARQDQRRHDCSFMDILSSNMLHTLEDCGVMPDVFGDAFTGSIPDLLQLYPYAPNEVKVFLLAVFPKHMHGPVREFFREPAPDNTRDLLMNYFELHV
jgi:hypothetical protein